MDQSEWKADLRENHVFLAFSLGVKVDGTQGKYEHGRTAEYRAQYTRLQCGVEGLREREIDPHHSGKETIANVIPSVAKHTSVRPPPTNTSQPSGASRGSRKRVRH